MATRAKTSTRTRQSGQLVCPECGRVFTRPQALGAHRRQAHGVAGTSKNARSKKPATLSSTAPSQRGIRRARPTSTAAATAGRTRKPTRAGRSAAVRPSGTGRGQAVDRDALLRALFPNGIPPQQDVIAAVNNWLDEAERLARIR